MIIRFHLSVIKKKWFAFNYQHSSSSKKEDHQQNLKHISK